MNESLFRQRLLWLRGEMTQMQFAEKLGVSRIVVGLWESGRTPGLKSLIKIADACDVSIDWLIGRS